MRARSPRCRTANAQSWFDPLAPDFARFPRAAQATPYVATCEPGETILCPGDWFHYAVALTPSITLMRNFMNDANVEPFMDVWNGRDRTKPPPAKPPMSPTRVPAPALPPIKSSPVQSSQLLNEGAAPPALPVSSVSSAFHGSQPPLPLPTPPGASPYPHPPTPSASDASVASGGSTVTFENCTVHAGRRVWRRPAGHGSASAVLPTAGSAGTVQHAVAPFDASCGRRVVTAWRWSQPRRGGHMRETEKT